MNNVLNFLQLDISIFIRLLLAVLVGAIIGIDRELKRRPGGIKTHSLVCLGSCLVMITAEGISQEFGSDITRIPAQVISGIGFLGAGTILVTGRNQIKGLTSAAGLWFSACQGLAIGIGYYGIAITALILSIIITNLFSHVDKLILKFTKYHDLHVEYTQKVSLHRILKILKQNDIKIINFDSYKGTSYHNEDVYVVIVQMKLTSGKTLRDVKKVLKELDGIILVEAV